jgi:outer membrane protein assembly factor BamE (lipoprotein component of BamABCDE complex)
MIALAITLLLCSACSSTRSERGVETRWHELQNGAFQEGQTTRKEVLVALGPPSQIVTMQHETALYYMLERTQGTGVTLVVYNFRREHSVYDRAVFFFNLDGVLTDFAYTDAPD